MTALFFYENEQDKSIYDWMSGFAYDGYVNELYPRNIMAYSINRKVLREMVMDSLRNYLGEEKSMLNERVSSVLFHFCDLGNLYYICNDNQFVLSTVYRGAADEKINQGKQFYLSCTRQIDGRQGYSSEKNVRIELDGDLLNQRFKGGPVDYWGVGMGKQSYYKEKYVHGVQSRTENEDRIFSNEPIIRDAAKYVKRIDILINQNNKKQMPIVFSICMTAFKDLIHLYDNKKDFLLRKTDGNPELLKDIASNSDYNISSQWESSRRLQERSIKRAIVDLLEIIYFGEYDSDKKAMEAAYKSLRAHNMDEYLPLVKEMNLRGFFDDYFANCQILFDDLRENPEVYQKFMKLFSEYLRSINGKSLNDIKKHKRNLIRGNGRWDIRDYDAYSNKEVEFLYRHYAGEDMIIPRPDKTSIWRILPNMRENFVSIVTGWGYDIPRHKSASDEQFLKYLRHLTRIDLSVSQYLDIVNRLNVSEDVKNQLRDRIGIGKLGFGDVWYGKYPSQEDKDVALNYFKKNG